MQKLSAKPKNVPRDASLVPCSTSKSLNRDQRLSVTRRRLTDNNSEENRSQHGGSSDLRVQNVVHVLNIRGEPLMPTTQQKASKLLKSKKASVTKRTPFIIQLNYATGENKQEITLGIDSGYRNIGFSAVTNKKVLPSLKAKYEIDCRTQC